MVKSTGDNRQTETLLFSVNGECNAAPRAQQESVVVFLVVRNDHHPLTVPWPNSPYQVVDRQTATVPQCHLAVGQGQEDRLNSAPALVLSPFHFDMELDQEFDGCDRDMGVMGLPIRLTSICGTESLSSRSAAEFTTYHLLTPNVAVLLSWLLDFCYRGFSSLSWQFDFAIVAFRSLSWLLPAIVAFSLMQSNDRSAKLY